MDKTEKAFLKQPKVFRSNVSGKGKRPGKEGHPFSKPAGLGFKSPGEATEERRPVDAVVRRVDQMEESQVKRGTDNLAGTSHSAKMNRIIIARRNYLQFIKKNR